MGPAGYLQHLTEQLADGVARLPVAFRERHAAYLLAAQNADGGFPGREGGSDLYYTAFGLRGLAVLDALTPHVAERAAGFLRRCLTDQASVVDFFSLLYACVLVQAAGGPDVFAGSPPDWPDRVAALLETFRTPDGGYGKTAGTASGSTYHTFLVSLSLQLLARPVPRADEVARFIESRRRDDGGYVEIAPMRRSGTNPTAAAVGVLQLTSALTEPVRQGVVTFLSAMPSGEGGFQANARAPLADLLSTFTGCWTLAQLGALDAIDTAATLRYARTVELSGGGFRGGLWDERSDVEYTFYGIGVIGLLEAASP
jgi:geranylgeranyl transferase type-2 subunit beta